MTSTVIGQIRRLRNMTVGELKIAWRELYGEPTLSRNKDFLFRRLAWRIQELEHGGLSDRTKRRLEELAPDSFARARTPNRLDHLAEPIPAHRPKRDPRLPSPGTVITREYKGRELRVVVREDGVEHDGAMFRSFTALAKHLTGSRNINGRLFFGLTERKR